MKHCIVTPDIVGPINNGGIGTHCHWLARLMAQEGFDVTVLFTGPIINGSEEKWIEYYADSGIKFVWLDTHIDSSVLISAFELQRRSYHTYLFLRDREFDAIHFQDWQANGLQTLQARRTLGHFSKTLITLTMHSGTRWIAEGGNHWYRRPLEDAMTNWAEAFTAAHADVVISPSRYMLDWVSEKGWRLPSKSMVIPVCTNGEPSSPQIMPRDGIIAFFGRLETRKGLEIFLLALKRLPASAIALVKEIHFVGKIGRVGRLSADEAIDRALAMLPVRFKIHSDLDSAAALALLVDLKANVFIPSLIDNYPLTVVEAANIGLPVYASRVGGISEILGAAHLFEPTPASLAAKIETALVDSPPDREFFYDAAVSRQWLDVLSKSEVTPSSPSVVCQQPLVSICVPFYNYGDYLPKLLESLRASNYTDFELIIIDDGSTDPKSVDVFNTLARDTLDLQVLFDRHENAGVGATRNAAAAKARGDYLIFMDADNLAKADMISAFLGAMSLTGADILTCYFDAFSQDRDPKDAGDIHHIYAPAGPALEVGWAENVFGDANFCIKRSVFFELGGFGTERDSSWEDWEFLLRAKLAGKAIDVIPKSLFWYRFTDEGFSRNTDLYKNQRRVMRPFLTAAGQDLAPVFDIMRQTSIVSGAPSATTPAGVLAGAIADKIYRRLGSPDGRFARALEKFFKRVAG